MFQWRNGGIVQNKKSWPICGSVNFKNNFGGCTGYSSFPVRVAAGKAVPYSLENVMQKHYIWM
jgi:hypothetical protein